MNSQPVQSKCSFLDEPRWKNRSFTYRELGIRYSPEVKPAVASRRLKQWVTGNPNLLRSLEELGWTHSQRLLTPKQVECIVRVLGEP